MTYKKKFRERMVGQIYPLKPRLTSNDIVFRFRFVSFIFLHILCDFCVLLLLLIIIIVYGTAQHTYSEWY